MDNDGKCNMLSIDSLKIYPQLKIILHEKCEAGKNYFIDFNIEQRQFMIHDDIPENKSLKELVDKYEAEYKKAYQEAVDGTPPPPPTPSPTFSDVSIITDPDIVRQTLKSIEDDQEA
jgi:hypothetical protein